MTEYTYVHYIDTQDTPSNASQGLSLDYSVPYQYCDKRHMISMVTKDNQCGLGWKITDTVVART